jgi:hypothetical protein
MNYDLFLAAWQQALVAARLQTLSFPTETIVLYNMARAYRDYVSLGRPFGASRFSITAELSWEWDALSSARSETVEEDPLPVLSWRGEPGARLICQLDGGLALAAVELPAWQGIILPRQWDNPDRGWDDQAPDEQLSDLFQRVARALQVWEASLHHLAGQA